MALDALTKRLIDKYDRPVPRYTSYPTAPYFNDKPSQDDVSKMLGELDALEPVSIYVHIPFCRTMYHYCGCHTQAIIDNKSPIERFAPLLLKEISDKAAALPQGIKISQIHFGGGTPNILPIPLLGQIMSALSSKFTRQGDTQIAMECDPRLLDKNYIQALARIGFTRISLGVQDFANDVQEATNRIQPFEDVRQNICDFRMETVEDFNVDLMVGLPHQTPQSVIKTANMAADLAPARMAVFQYAHVPWMKRHQKLLEKHGLPEKYERFEMSRNVEKTLADRGYTAVGIDHFALNPEFIRRNFQGYSDDEANTIIGFGPSSISALPCAYLQNITSTASWAKAVEAGENTSARGCILTDDDKTRADVISQIMCVGETDSANLGNKEQMTELEDDGLIKISGNSLKITEKGRPFTRLVAACFDANYDPTVQNRHAKAV